MLPKPTREPMRTVMTDQVYDRILERLMDGSLESGARISIDGMARDLDVSPTPVREALARLEPTGIVSRVALRGYRVPDLLTRKEMADLMDTRLLIEPRCAQLAAEQVDESLVGRLRGLISEQIDSPKFGHFREYRPYFDADERFHRLIAEHTNNRFMVRAYDAIGGQVQRFRLFRGRGIVDADHAIAEHELILEALEQHSPKDAYRAMRSHVRSARQRVLEEMDQESEDR